MRFLTQKLFWFGEKFLPLLYLTHAGKSTIIYQINHRTQLKIRVNTFDIQALYEVWGMKEYENHNFIIGRGDVVVDIGAHIGAFSVWAAQKADQGRVLAFEPNPDNFALLEENKTLNNLTNLYTSQTAITAAKGHAKLFNSDSHNMTHSLFEEGTRSYDLVPTMSLADIFEENQLKRVHFLKIDAEGAEYEIILDAPDDFLRRIDKIIIEYHDYLDLGHSYKELTAHLSVNGFEIETGASAFHRYILKLGLILAHRPSQTQA